MKTAKSIFDNADEMEKDVMTYIKGLRPQNKIAAAFGSYGWSGEAVKILNKDF